MRGDQGLQGRDREAQGHAVGRWLAWQWLLGPSLIRGQADFQGECCPWYKRRATADLHTLPRHRSVGAGLCSEGHCLISPPPFRLIQEGLPPHLPSWHGDPPWGSHVSSARCRHCPCHSSLSSCF